jgi:hypothetical protein
VKRPVGVKIEWSRRERISTDSFYNNNKASGAECVDCLLK